MPASAPNTVETTILAGRREAGDLPEGVRRRYLADRSGGPGLGFYVDATVATPAFRDRGDRLTTARNDPNVVRDLIAIAEHRGWSKILVRGDRDFQREVWLAGRAAGLEVHGYRPTHRDLEAERRAAERTQPAPDRTSTRDPSASRLRAIDTVVRQRVADPIVQERIMASARARIAAWLERGARLDPFPARESRSPERNR